MKKTDFTIDFNSGGNHGHQLKDALGGLTIGKLFNLKYIHSPYAYLQHFALGYKSTKKKRWYHNTFIKYNRIERISGPLWNGIDDYELMVDYFNEKLKDVDSKTLLIFDNALRIHPFQTILWYNEGKIQSDIFNEILSETTNNFRQFHNLETQGKQKNIKVAIHINRGVDFDQEKYPLHFKDSKYPRFIFPVEYYKNIMDQLEYFYGYSNIEFTIYTEELNSSDIISEFKNRKNTNISIGSNRDKINIKNHELVHHIFNEFVNSDILVSSNSSFSAICAYFRKDKTTIYHPHNHLNYLPEPNFLATTIDGEFRTDLLKSII